MATCTKIEVTKCDNELYIIAIPATAGLGSFEILHMSSGFGNPVNYTVIPQSILPKGNYTLSFLGINWGGPQEFHVTLTIGGVATPGFVVPLGPAPVGCTSHTVAITV